MNEAPKDQTPDALTRAINRAIKEGIEKTVRLRKLKRHRLAGGRKRLSDCKAVSL